MQPGVFERPVRRRHRDVPVDAIHSFRTSVPSSGTDSLADTSVIIFAFRSLGNSVAALINALHSSAISRRKYFRREMRSVTLTSASPRLSQSRDEIHGSNLAERNHEISHVSLSQITVLQYSKI